MGIKMIVTDLDRTLLRSDKTISDYTAKILKKCQDNGIKVVFATARPNRTVKPFFNTALADAVILHNGAVIYVNDDKIFHCGITSSVANNILLSIISDFPDATLSVEIDDVFYANFDVSTVWNYTEAIHTDFTNLPNKSAEKIIVGVSSMEEIDRFSKYLPNDLYIEMSDGKLGLIMNKGATKMNAVSVIAKHYGCSIKDIVSFGDDYNDLGMIRDCGVGVAMQNALDEVKSVTNHICESNDNDGVAKWLEANVL